MEEQKISLDNLIPTTLEGLSELTNINKKALLKLLPEKEQELILDSNNWLSDFISTPTEFKQVDWLKHFNPFTDDLPDLMPKQFTTICELAKPILGSLEKHVVSDLLLTALVFNQAIKLIFEFKNGTPLHSKISAIVEQKPYTELTPAYRIKKKITWSELLAATALLEVYFALIAWHSQYNEKTSEHPLTAMISEFKLYDLIFIDCISQGMASVTLAEELHQKKKASSKGGKSSQKFSILKKRLKVLYKEKYYMYSNRQAAECLIDELNEEDYKKFNTDYPRETIERWVASWKNNDDKKQ